MVCDLLSYLSQIHQLSFVSFDVSREVTHFYPSENIDVYFEKIEK
jgi:hypothetical protein